MIYANQETELKFKKLFAAALMKNPANPFACAREIETDENRVRQIALAWPQDQDIVEYRRELLASRGGAALVPTKEEFAVSVFNEIRDITDKKEKLAYMQFFAKVMGFVDDSRTAVNVNVGGSRGKIMAVPLVASDDAWERAAKEYQQRLIASG